MRQSSVVCAHTASQTVNINQEKKEKVTMRKSFATAIALVIALTVASPVAAAPRKGDRTEPPAFALVLKKLIKRFFGVQTTADPVVPIPAPRDSNPVTPRRLVRRRPSRRRTTAPSGFARAPALRSNRRSAAWRCRASRSRGRADRGDEPRARSSRVAICRRAVPRRRE